ncbi:MAG: hypothetical protein V4722_00365 [Bacteroidota bacterium]
MKLIQLLGSVFLSYISLAGHAQQAVPFNDKKWVIESQGSLQEFYKGYNCLYLQNGQAYLKDEKFGNGVIEFDICLTERVSFSGIIFRIIDSKNFEELYFRSQLSGMPDAYQYAPVCNGNSSWQLYHDQHDAVNDGYIHWKPAGNSWGYNGVLNYVFDEWMHVKLVVKGSQAELYLGKNPQPVAFIKELKRGPAAGSIGIKSAAGATRFANFSFTATDNPEMKSSGSVNVQTPNGTVSNWQLSSSFFKEAEVSNTYQLDPKLENRQSWKNIQAEKTGIINISALGAIIDSANTVFAKLVVVSDKDQVKKLNIGYSDAIRAFCNGQLSYSGSNAFWSRDYKYLGTIGFFDALYLPLKKGENTIVLAISEGLGGWGIMAKWENMDGIRLNQQPFLKKATQE